MDLLRVDPWRTPPTFETLALLLTLLGTPAAYSLFDDWATKRPVRSVLARFIPALRAASPSLKDEGVP